MSRLVQFWVAAFLAALASVASAATFEFSYTYSLANGGHKMTGTLSGVRDQNGTPLDPSDDFLVAPTVLSAAFNSVAMISSPLLLRRYDDTGMHDVATNVYFEVTANNFIISPCADTACVLAAYGNPAQTIDVFFLRNLGGSPNVQHYSELTNAVFNDPVVTSGVWSLTEVTPVPEPATYALFACGLGSTLLAARRQRRLQR